MNTGCTPNTPYTKPVDGPAVTTTAEKWYLEINEDVTNARLGQTAYSFTVVPCETSDTCAASPAGKNCATWTFGDGTTQKMCTNDETCGTEMTNDDGAITINCDADKKIEAVVKVEEEKEKETTEEPEETNAKMLVTEIFSFFAAFSYIA